MKERYNLTLDKEVKEELTRQAKEIGLSVSSYITVLVRDIQKKGER